MDTQKKNSLALPLIFICVGIAVILGGVYFSLDYANFKKNALPAAAVITGIEEYRDSDGDTAHDVYVAFNVDNVEYKGKLNFYRAGMMAGDQVGVLYTSGDPGRFRHDGSGNTFMVVFLVIFGSIFTLAGILFLISSRKRPNNYL